MSGTPRIASPGNPPLLWSDIEQAFNAINQNFNELYATIQSDGSTQVVNFAALYDDVSPGVDGVYELGDFTKSWKKLNLTTYSETPGNELNGLWLGLAHVIDDGATVVLPPDSRVGSDLIIDSSKTFWKTFSIDNENFVEAADFADTLSINSGTAMQIVVDSAAESLTFNNIGVTSLIAGTGTSVSFATGNVTMTNTGVIALTNGASLPSGLSEGSGISVSAATGNIAITNTGVIDVQNGFGITVSRDNATGIVTVTNSAPAQVAYRTITVSGSSDLVADTTSDTLVVEAGYGMVITTSEVVEDTLIIAVDPNIDITGSVFANDSSIMVDSIDQKIFAAGGIAGDLIGNTVGYHTGDVKGSVFGDDSTKIVDAVENKIYIPELVTTEINSLANTLVLRSGMPGGTGAELFINPYGSNTVINTRAETYLFNTGPFASTGNPQIEFTTAGAFKTYNGAYFEGNVTGNITGNIFTNLIDSADSSAITVTPAAIFSSDVTVDNELFIGTSRVMAIDELKTIVAASTDFANFQARIAAL